MGYVTSNLDLEMEELKETSHTLIDTLAAVAPAKTTLPSNKAVLCPVKVLWQPPFLWPLHQSRLRRNTMCPLRGLAFFFLPHSSGVSGGGHS